MNKKGFTLIEILVVISILGLVAGIVITNVTKYSTKVKEKALNAKIKNIEKAAIIYGQDHKNKFTSNSSDNELCKDVNDNLISNCYYFERKIKVIELTTTTYDEYGNEIKYMNSDDENGNIINPTETDKMLNKCEIQLYKKYGKIYASYIKNTPSDASDNTKCWK